MMIKNKNYILAIPVLLITGIILFTGLLGSLANAATGDEAKELYDHCWTKCWPSRVECGIACDEKPGPYDQNCVDGCHESWMGCWESYS